MGDARWPGLASSVLIEAVSGSAYAFSVYAPQLKAAWNYTQLEINNVGAVGDLGMYFSIVGGVAYDIVGPRVSLAIGAATSFVGYSLLYLAATKRVGFSSAATSLFAALAWHGSGWLDVAVVSTNVQSFAPNKGVVLGLLKSQYGLSASLVSLAYASLFKPDVNSFLLFLTFLIPVVVFPCLWFLKSVDPAQARPLSFAQRAKVNVSYGLVALSVAFLVAVSLLQGRGVIATAPWYAYVLIPMVLAHLVLAVPVSGGHGDTAEEAKDVETDIDSMDASLLPKKDAVSPSPPVSKTAAGATFFEGILTVDYAIIGFMMFASTGSGLVVINNLGNLVESLGAAADGQDVYVSLLSVSNCMGRIVYGALSDTFSSRLARPGWFAFLVLNMAGATAMLAFSTLDSLYVAAMWAGFTYGGFWSLGPSLVAERFGGRNFASINSLTNVFTAMSSYAFNAGLAASVYQSHSPPGSTVCTGMVCFQSTFLILCGCNVVAALAGLWLVRRMAPFYDAHGKARTYAIIAGSLPRNMWAEGIDSLLAQAVGRKGASHTPQADGGDVTELTDR